MAPRRSHVPGIPRRSDPSRVPGWVVEPLALWCWCPPKPSFRDLASPAQAGGQQRPWPLGCPSTFYPCSLRLRLEGAPGALSWRAPGSLPVSGLSEASSERCAMGRVTPRGCFPLTPPGKVREASAAKCTSRLREVGGTDATRPGLSGAAAVERRSPWAQAARKALERYPSLRYGAAPRRRGQIRGVQGQDRRPQRHFPLSSPRPSPDLSSGPTSPFWVDQEERIVT